MFLPSVESREWLTPKEALGPDIRELYENGNLNKPVYLQDPRGGRGHYIDLKVFYDYHLTEAFANNFKIEDVIYEQNGAISGAYYEFDGYAGPMQNLLSSNDVFGIEDIQNMALNGSEDIYMLLDQINNLKNEPIDLGSLSAFEGRMLEEINEELEYLGVEVPGGTFKDETEFKDAYNQDIINALDSLRNTQ